MSSLPGAASSIKVEGVLHEFSTIPGVKEDLVEIILNLKELAIRMEQDEPKVITVNTRAQGTDRCGYHNRCWCGDLKRRQTYCYSNEDARLYMEITIERAEDMSPPKEIRSPASP